jgi:type II secretory pathway component PulC
MKMNDELNFDINGNVINLGCNVVFGLAGTMKLAKGRVTKINKKTVTIEYQGVEVHWGIERTVVSTCNRAFENVAVVQ